MSVVTRSWADTRAARSDITDGLRAQARSELLAELTAHRLAAIRKELNLTQTQVAKLMHVGQRRVSAIESARLGNTEIGTLSAYVEALGGRLHLVADFGDQTVLVDGDLGTRAH